jgi:hypothetical protein
MSGCIGASPWIAMSRAVMRMLGGRPDGAAGDKGFAALVFRSSDPFHAFLLTQGVQGFPERNTGMPRTAAPLIK